MSPEDAQRTADVAQFYLHAAAGLYASALGHPFIDIGRVELKLQEALELGFKPGNPERVLEAFMCSSEAWPLFPGDKDPPLL